MSIPGTSRRSVALGPLASLAAHALVLTLLAYGPALRLRADSSHILPALYLYAADRRPSEIRETRIPVPADPGIPDGGAGRPGGGVGFAPPGAPAPPKGLPEPGPDSPRIDSVFSVLAVDRPVERLPESAAPAYPADLLKAGIEGSVVAEFVVDTDGRVDLATVRILTSTDSAFTASVRTALAGMQFRPAQRGLNRVRQLVEQRFSFTLIQPPPSISM